MKQTLIHVLILLISLLGVFQKINAQTPTQTIRGIVQDQDSKMPIPSASVTLSSVVPNRTVLTDSNGLFSITDIVFGRHALRVSATGYETIEVPEINVGAGKEVVLTLEVKENIFHFKSSGIVAKGSKDKPVNSMATVSARSFTVDEASRYAGSFADPGRMASSFAGVVSNNSFTNEITVRGNSPKGLLWRIEGIEVPTPNHLSGFSRNGGVVSVLSTNAMDNSDFMTGAFPAEYGNASSGVFDIHLRKGNNKRYENAFQANLFGVQATSEGPLSKKSGASYLINYRYSTTAVFGNLGLLNKDEGLPTWQDLSFKLNFPLKKLGYIQVFGVAGRSGVNESALKDTLEWKYEYNNINSKFYSNMGVVGASSKINLSKKAYIKTVIAATSQNTGHHADSVDTDFNATYFGKSKTDNYSLVLSSFVNFKFRTKSVFRSGIILTSKSYQLYAEDKAVEAPHNIRPLVDSKGQFTTAQAYFQWKYRISKKIELNTGLHGMYMDFNKNTSIEPRAAVNWDFAPKQSLSAGFGVHSRMELASVYFEKVEANGNQTMPNKNLKLAHAYHYVLAYKRRFGDAMHLKVEAYYQVLTDVPIANKANSTFSILNNESPITGQILANKGSGQNKGIEVSLEHFFKKNYYFLATGSLYDARYKAADGIERNTRYNGRFVCNILGGKEFPLKKNKSIGIDIRMVVAGGNRTTPIDLQKSQLERTTVYDETKLFSEQAPTYFRPDFKISYTRNRNGSKRILSLDIQNVCNQQNLLNTSFDSKQNKVVKNYQFGILPNITYRIEF